MKVVITPHYDSDNSSPPELIVDTDTGGGECVTLVLSDPRRLIMISKKEWREMMVLEAHRAKEEA